MVLCFRTINGAPTLASSVRKDNTNGLDANGKGAARETSLVEVYALEKKDWIASLGPEIFQNLLEGKALGVGPTKKLQLLLLLGFRIFNLYYNLLKGKVEVSSDLMTLYYRMRSRIPRP